jgi:hypothetical protein
MMSATPRPGSGNASGLMSIVDKCLLVREPLSCDIDMDMLDMSLCRTKAVSLLRWRQLRAAVYS